jgi:anhydro-N-acetylmuramic acid kinase
MVILQTLKRSARMETLEKLFRMKKKLIVGLMSGTSADGIDAALVEIRGSGEKSLLRLLAYETYDYPRGYKQFLLKNSDTLTARLDDITRLDMLIATFFADAVKKIIRKANKHHDEIDLIGSHGQTIHHLPVTQKMFGKNIRGTMQIGNPSAIAKLTGIITVGDFRTGDVAVGGTGAPLVPLYDFLMLRSKKVIRAILNIGGIANITLLPKNCSIDHVLAFDTGPGNMVIDKLMQQFYNKPFDKNGETASEGKILPSLLFWLAQHKYFNLRPPKSTGREMFGDDFVKSILKKADGARKKDIISTVTEFTALSIYESYLKFIQPKRRIQELIVSGGGVHNKYIMGALRRYFDGISIITTDAAKIPIDAKEAMCFALLANETISGNPGNVPGATGAKKQTVLGTICLP